MVQAALTKADAALKGACERSGKGANDIKLSNVYQPGIDLTAQQALTELARAPQLFVCLQRAQRLIDKLSTFYNLRLAHLEKRYKQALQEYINATKEGSVYYRMLHEIGINLFPLEKAYVTTMGNEVDEIVRTLWLQDFNIKGIDLSQPDTITVYEEAWPTIARAACYAEQEHTLVWLAWERVEELTEEIASLAWPEKDNDDVHSLVGSDLEKDLLTQSFTKEKMNTFALFTAQLGAVVQATLNKVDAALKAANERCGEDQNNTMLSDLYEAGTSITVHEALIQLKKSKPFELLQRAPKIINALGALSNKALAQAKNDLKEAYILFAHLMGNDSAWGKALAANIPDLPLQGKREFEQTPENMITTQKIIGDIVDSGANLSIVEVQTMLNENLEINEQLQETAITEHTRQAITNIAKRITQTITTLSDKEVFCQDLSGKPLDKLINDVIPKMIIAVLGTIDKNMKTLNEKARIDQNARNKIMKKIQKIRGDKTYTALKTAAEVLEFLQTKALPLQPPHAISPTTT